MDIIQRNTLPILVKRVVDLLKRFKTLLKLPLAADQYFTARKQRLSLDKPVEHDNERIHTEGGPYSLPVFVIQDI